MGICLKMEALKHHHLMLPKPMRYASSNIPLKYKVG